MEDTTTSPRADNEVATGVAAPRDVADKLGEVLNATYELVLHTHSVHWNVEGPLFYAVHMLTEAQYGELFDATDVIAERIRALGALAPMRLSGLVDPQNDAREGPTHNAPAASEMIASLESRHRALARLCHETVELAEAAADPVTADLATARSAVHEKAAWMLGALVAR
jgi:starvation-inducible DNA-binding protein